MAYGVKTYFNEAFQKLRSWLDNEIYIFPTFRAKSRSDVFAERARSEIEKTMAREKFCYEESKTLIPTRYTVIISEKDNAEWYGIKLHHLQKALDSFVIGKLRSISLDPRNEKYVYIRSAQNIKEGEIRVIHQWEENEPPVKIVFNDKRMILDPDEEREDTITSLPYRGAIERKENGLDSIAGCV